MITAYLQVKKADNTDSTVIAALPEITGADEDALVLGTVLNGCHSAGPAFETAKHIRHCASIIDFSHAIWRSRQRNGCDRHADYKIKMDV